MINWLQLMKLTTMKKPVVVLIALLGTAALAACVSTTTPTQNTHAVNTGHVSGIVLISDKPPSVVEREIAALSRPQVIQYLYDLDQADRRYLEPSPDNITVVYALFGRIEPGNRVNTRWTVTRSTMPQPFSENYDYVISSTTPQSPLIILNALYNENPGTFTFEARLDGKVVASTTKIYRHGSN